MALSLEVLQGHDEDYSHFMAEDFADDSMLDTFAAKVTRLITGSDTLEVERSDGIIPGSYYTLSDGLTSETVQVDHVNVSSSVQRVILTSSIRNTYTLANTKLFRTNVTIEDGSAVGAKAQVKAQWLPGLIWRGTEGSETFTVNADLSVSNAASYKLLGDAVLTSSSMASLAQ